MYEYEYIYEVPDIITSSTRQNQLLKAGDKRSELSSREYWYQSVMIDSFSTGSTRQNQALKAGAKSSLALY
jgi:hypothetical protein